MAMGPYYNDRDPRDQALTPRERELFLESVRSGQWVKDYPDSRINQSFERLSAEYGQGVLNFLQLEANGVVDFRTIRQAIERVSQDKKNHSPILSCVLHALHEGVRRQVHPTLHPIARLKESNYIENGIALGGLGLLAGILTGSLNMGAYAKKLPEKVAPEVDKKLQVEIDQAKDAGKPFSSTEIAARYNAIQQTEIERERKHMPGSLKYIGWGLGGAAVATAVPNLVGFAASGALARRRREERTPD